MQAGRRPTRGCRTPESLVLAIPEEEAVKGELRGLARTPLGNSEFKIESAWNSACHCFASPLYIPCRRACSTGEAEIAGLVWMSGEGVGLGLGF